MNKTAFDIVEETFNKIASREDYIKKVNEDIEGFRKSHPKYQEAVKEEDFNKERAKVKNPRSGLVSTGVGATVGLSPLLAGAGLGAAINSKGRKADGAFGQALAFAPLLAGSIPAGIKGGTVIKKKMDEKYRNKKVGKKKNDASFDLAMDTNNYFMKKYTKNI